MAHFVAFFISFQKIIPSKIPPGGGTGVIGGSRTNVLIPNTTGTLDCVRSTSFKFLLIYAAECYRDIASVTTSINPRVHTYISNAQNHIANLLILLPNRRLVALLDFFVVHLGLLGSASKFTYHIRTGSPQRSTSVRTTHNFSV